MSICTRCGKQRIVVSSHNETVSKSDVVYTETVCPDPECQKIVEKKLEDDKRKREVLEDERVRRINQKLSAKKNS